MKNNVNAAVLLLSGLATFVAAKAPLAVITPCASCPTDVAPAPITVTAQHQSVSTCKPKKHCKESYGKRVCKVVPECSSYAWVSTTIPCEGGSTSTLVTKTDQVVKVAHYSTVQTETASVDCPSPTPAPYFNGTVPSPAAKANTCYTTKYTTVDTDVSVPYNEIGPVAIPGYEGSGLCKKCATDKKGNKNQGVHIKKCVNGACNTYTENWVSTKEVPVSSVSATVYQTDYKCPSKGEYTIPVTQTYAPIGHGYKTPVTKTFTITTSVAHAQELHITKTVYVTYQKPRETKQVKTTNAVLSTKTYCSKNGVYTVPLVSTITANNPKYTNPVTTTVYYTTTVTDGPKEIKVTETVKVKFTSTYCPGTKTQGPSGPAYASPSATNSAYPTSSSGAYPTHGSSKCQYSGCFGSPNGFPSFSLAESSGALTVDICNEECIDGGYAYSGLYDGECYCAASLGSCEEVNKGQGSCNLPCPGKSSESCGGNLKGGKKSVKLFDVYECEIKPTPTPTQSEYPTATESNYPADPSSDVDEPVYKRNIDADIELENQAAVKVRRGGLFKSERAPAKHAAQKRSFGIKQALGY